MPMTNAAIDRRSAVAELLAARHGALVVTGLGSPSYDVHAHADTPDNYYLWGAMGGAALVGLGLAQAQPKRRVMVITGDGEQLMAMGALATIAVARPANLDIIVLDNQHYGETGMQETATKHGVDIVAMARGAGFQRTMFVTKPEEVPALKAAIHAGEGPFFAVAKIDAASKKLILPPRDGAIIQARMREAILGPQAHHQL